jgi:hypothetical protein
LRYHLSKMRRVETTSITCNLLGISSGEVLPINHPL